ncbi:DUF6114 domain-containing protein [Kitasatospora viridis]|uniref:Integral membrane protein n=1 Tax=Kitasatospora viridis TaxID=281105 RepID=A0A561UES1_9ACTN|nr:DUF6114 domain-containing protein [Kitasatospora viridis]TWF97863.1 hypothetical protein FHX73_111664 [Kitasatospora viridis]
MTTATADLPPEHAAPSVSFAGRFRNWRRSRPFWGGLLAVVAGLPILYFPYAHLHLGDLTMAMSTTAGAGSLVIGILLMVLGVSAWFQPGSRIFCGVGVTILTLISIPVSNLGGFLMGLIPGLIAGGLLCAWTPLTADQLVAATEKAAKRRPAEQQLGENWAARTADVPAQAEPAPVEQAAPAATAEATGEDE